MRQTSERDSRQTGSPERRPAEVRQTTTTQDLYLAFVLKPMAIPDALEPYIKRNLDGTPKTGREVLKHRTGLKDKHKTADVGCFVCRRMTSYHPEKMCGDCAALALKETARRILLNAKDTPPATRCAVCTVSVERGLTIIGEMTGAATSANLLTDGRALKSASAFVCMACAALYLAWNSNPGKMGAFVVWAKDDEPGGVDCLWPLDRSPPWWTLPLARPLLAVRVTEQGQRVYKLRSCHASHDSRFVTVNSILSADGPVRIVTRPALTNTDRAALEAGIDRIAALRLKEAAALRAAAVELSASVVPDYLADFGRQPFWDTDISREIAARTQAVLAADKEARRHRTSTKKKAGRPARAA